MDEQSENFRTNFKVKDSAARQGRNPGAGETIEIAASRKLGFSPLKQVEDALAA